ncbi:hypothetical protein M9H77_07512 [Catharanthus roseus]|uniref:Uncharacterized protein n=1 Tax=Catharanthus roseus TaxID=4058 RepID=A0ACC0BVD9_CATRO|nr:hypothetical protein M9H77_07512 [Catharanthus roseus]
MERSYGVWLVLNTRCRNLVPMASFWGSRLCPWSPTVALHVLLNLGRRSCADISSERSGAQQATEVLGQEFLDQISPERHMIVFYYGTYNLVPRGTQMPYSATVDLVAGLGASQQHSTNNTPNIFDVPEGQSTAIKNDSKSAKLR